MFIEIYKRLSFVVLAASLLTLSCNKDPEYITGNIPPNPDNVPMVLIENYVNRIFIDLIGREPLDAEMDSNVFLLKNNDLTIAAREQIIERLQTDTSWIEGDTSYKHAYYQRFYDISKARVLEGESDAEIMIQINLLSRTLLVDSLSGDTIPTGNAISSARAALEIEKLENVLKVKNQYRDDSIGVDEIYRRLCNNYVYDQINMNTFNFIRASFNDLFYRFPTTNEFDNAWEMVEKNHSVNIFGRNGQNRGEYLEILTDSREFYEGMIMWAYLNLLARFPSSEEVSGLMDEFYLDHDFQMVQKKIMITNEYANF